MVTLKHTLATSPLQTKASIHAHCTQRQVVGVRGQDSKAITTGIAITTPQRRAMARRAAAAMPLAAVAVAVVLAGMLGTASAAADDCFLGRYTHTKRTETDLGCKSCKR